MPCLDTGIVQLDLVSLASYALVCLILTVSNVTQRCDQFNVGRVEISCVASVVGIQWKKIKFSGSQLDIVYCWVVVWHCNERNARFCDNY